MTGITQGDVMADIDDTDLRLIELLQEDARTPQHELAKLVGLAASSVNERIRKLGERGLITGYHARISPDVLGYDLLAFIYVAWSKPETEKAFLKKVLTQATVVEIHHVTGLWNYMLKVRVKNTRMLEGLLAKVIKSVLAEFPPDLARMGIEGSVVAKLYIDDNGDVKRVKIVESAGHGLDELAKNALKQFKFSPARTSDGKAVPVNITYKYTFELPQ